jgi:hypothetical protein
VKWAQFLSLYGCHKTKSAAFLQAIKSRKLERGKRKSHDNFHSCQFKFVSHIFGADLIRFIIMTLSNGMSKQ